MPIKITLTGCNEKYPCEIMGTPQEVWQLVSHMETVMAVKKCDVCGSADVHPTARPAEGPGGPFIAYKWFCNDCLSNVSLGVSKEHGSLYLKWDTKWYKSDKKSESSSEPKI